MEQDLSVLVTLTLRADGGADMDIKPDQHSELCRWEAQHGKRLTLRLWRTDDQKADRAADAKTMRIRKGKQRIR